MSVDSLFPAKVIHKFPLQVGSHTILRLPKTAQVLCADSQHDLVQLWALVPTDQALGQADLIERTFRVVCTGETFDAGRYQYLSTFQAFDGRFVGHVFEKVL